MELHQQLANPQRPPLSSAVLTGRLRVGISDRRSGVAQIHQRGAPTTGANVLMLSKAGD